MKKRIVVIIVTIILVGNPIPVHAEGFFLFNIIGGLLGTKHEKKVEIVKFGSKGKQVVTVQEFLIRANYLSGKADGVYGYQTLSAVKDFQQTVKLSADGVVGAQTFKALKEYKGKKSNITKKPIQKPKPSVPSGIPPYKYAVSVVTTAYTRYDEGCDDLTYLETYARRGVIAVDPNVIPLRSKVYIPGYGYGSAEDIGGAIQGNRVDLFMETLEEAFAYGVREVTVYVLE